MISDDKENPLMMCSKIFNAIFAWRKCLQLAIRFVSREKPHFGRSCTVMIRQNILIVTCFDNKKKIGFILFVKDQCVLCRIHAKTVTEQLERSFCPVQREIVKGLAIICPFHAGMEIYTAIGICNCFGIERVRPQ